MNSFQCKHCIATYAHKSGLNRHVQKQHPDEMRYSCRFPSCDFATNTRDELLRHTARCIQRSQVPPLLATRPNIETYYTNSAVPKPETLYSRQQPSSDTSSSTMTTASSESSRRRRPSAAPSGYHSGASTSSSSSSSRSSNSKTSRKRHRSRSVPRCQAVRPMRARVTLEDGSTYVLKAAPQTTTVSTQTPKLYYELPTIGMNQPQPPSSPPPGACRGSPPPIASTSGIQRRAPITPRRTSTPVPEAAESINLDTSTEDPLQQLRDETILPGPTP